MSDVTMEQALSALAGLIEEIAGLRADIVAMRDQMTVQAMLPQAEHHDQNLDIVLLRLLDRVHRYEDQIRAVEDAHQRFDTRLRALEERE